MAIKTNYVLFSGITVVVLLIIFYSFSDIQVSDKYLEELKKFRADKNAQFRTEDTSPIPQGERPGFKGLAYFDPDPAYRIGAALKLLEDTLDLAIPTNTEETRPMRRYAHVEFKLNGQPVKLTLFKYVDESADKNSLFLPFADASNGQDTYSMGRYLDIDVAQVRANQVTIDFNMAYNPYCAYTDEFSCPLPPPENRLPLKVMAGEKAYLKTE
jgi:uncharacterized protein